MPDPEPLRERLRRVAYPGFQTDIVAAGFVRDVRLDDTGVATVFFAPNTTDETKVKDMVAGVRATLASADGVREVRVKRMLPFQPEPSAAEPRDMTPLQAELLAAGVVPQPDLLGPATVRPDVAPEAGYGDGGPTLDSPPLESRDRYDGWPPVLQWEIDPTDPDLETGEDSVFQAGWEYDVWWQVHPAGLVYVSIQAVKDDARPEAGARAHPVGRNVVVNLVHDLRRQAVVAVYGTARDFRPFVDAFRIAYGLEPTPGASLPPRSCHE